MESSPALQNYAQGKIEVEIEKFVTKPIEAHLTFSVEKHQQHVLCVLTGGDGFMVNVEHRCEDMYASVDFMINKLVTQLQKKKEKLKDHKHFRGVRSITPDDDLHEMAEIDAADILKYEQAAMRRRG